MTERARAIPLATLVCVVGALAALRVSERLHSGFEARRRDEARTSADAGPPPIARSTTLVGDAGAALAPPGMLHGDSHHTHRANAAGPTRAQLGWTAAVGAPIEAQVVASRDERTLYVATLDGWLVALDAQSGATGWRVSLGDRVYSTPCVGPDGTLYVGSDAKRFYALTPKGAIAWKLETSGEADTGAVLAGDLIVFAAGASVLAVRPGGDIAWRFEARKKVFTAPAVGEHGAIIFGSQDHRVYALSPAGALSWSVDLGADVDGAPVVGDDGAVTVGTDAGEIVRVTAAGDVVWRTQVGGYVRGTLSLSRGGDVLAGVYGPTPRVVRLDPAGRVVASFEVQGTGSRELGVHGGPLEDVRGALFFGAQDDELHAVGPDGAWSWSFTTGGDVDAPLTLLSTGALVAASDDGNVYCFLP